MRSVQIAVVLMVCLVVPASCPAQAAKPLTNQDVIEMVAAGLPESTILLSIKQSPASFSTSPQDLIALKKSGVSPAIMDAMMTHGAGTAGAAPSAAPAGESALIPTAYGQYAVAGGRLVSLPGIPVDLVFGIRLVDGGVAADGFKASREAAVIEDLKPQFIVYAHQLDPRQVKLARLKLVETMTAWEFNVRGSDPGPFQAIYGVSPSKVIDVNLRRASEPIGLAIEPVVGRAGMYRFTPQRPLERGEHYALYLGDALHDIEYLVTEKLNRAPVHAVLFKTPGVSATSKDALAAQLTTLLQRPQSPPQQPDKTYVNDGRGVSFSYPADFELSEEKAPVVAFLAAPNSGGADTVPTKISVTCATAPKWMPGVNLEAAIKSTLETTRATLANSTIGGPVKTSVAGVDAHVFLVTGLEAGVLRQKAVTVAVSGNSVLGIVLHATPATFEQHWDTYQRVVRSYTLR